MTHQYPQPAILHVDMDAFYASVELLERPDLVGKPAAVGGDGPRSIVTSATYEARARGVRSAMPVSQAKRLCPELVMLPVSMEKYRAMSRRIMEIFNEFTPLVEPLSIDEAFLDVTGARRLHGSPRAIASAVRERIAAQTGLPSSVGIATTKFVAKLASQRAKPNGILEIEPEHTLEFVQSLPIAAMWGVGQATEEKLRGRGIHTIADLADTPLTTLERAVGSVQAYKLHELAHARDPRPVVTDRVEKSVSSEETFLHDISDLTPMMRELLKLSQKTAARLRAKGFVARTVVLKVKFADFTTVTRSHTLPEPTDSSQRMYDTMLMLLDEADLRGRSVRLLGVGAEHLRDADDAPEPLWSDHDDETWRALDRTNDELRRRFGGAAPSPARLIEPHE